jgi:signal transduction histidine kinase
MSNKSSIVFKILIAIVVFFALIVTFFFFANNAIIKKNLQELTKEKISSTAKSIIPLLCINQSFGLQDQSQIIIDSVQTSNSDIVCLVLKDKDQKKLYIKGKKDLRSNLLTFTLNDPITKEKIGILEVYYQNEQFKKLVEEYFMLSLKVAFVAVLFFIIFIMFLRKKLLPLTLLAEKLKEYDPSKQKGLDIKCDFTSNKKDEIAVITETILVMIGKIDEYTKKLNDINKNLENSIKEEVEKNRKKDKMLIQQSRHAALGEMLGNIAHQWRQPLNTLGLMLQDLEDVYVHDELDKEYLYTTVTKAMEIIFYMSETINDFRDFFVPEKDKMYFNLYNSINDTLKITGAMLKENNIELINKIDKNFEVFGLPNEFSQVIINLINNSKDAYVKCEECKDKKIIIDAKIDTEHIHIFINDQAGGIKEDIIEKIFDPYFTTKHKSQGTGLGLYMSKTIIEQSMQGSIDVYNTDYGVRFIIALPIKPAKQ